MGIPCRHELLRRYRADKAFTLEKADFHPFQWLVRNLAADDEYLRMQEFDRVQALRGRPRGSDAFASDPNMPQLTAPHPTQVVPAIQPVPALQATPSQGRGRGRPRGSRGTTRGAGLAASIRHEPSQFGREDLTEVESRRPRTINGLGSV